jgi:hypothetical protein
LPEEVDSFYGEAGELYNRFRKLKRQRWKKALAVAGFLVGVLVLDMLMLLFFKVNAVRAAWWTGDGKAIVYAKQIGTALDYATNVSYAPIGGDEVWAWRLDTGKKEQLMARGFDGRLATYPGTMDGEVVWMSKSTPKKSMIYVFLLKDPLSPLSWTFEGPDTAIMTARGRRALVCRDRGDVGLLEMGGDPLFVFHAPEPHTLYEPGLSGIGAHGARAFFAEKTARGTSIFGWDKRLGKALKITTTQSTLVHFTNDAGGGHFAMVLKDSEGRNEHELWIGDILSGKLNLVHKSRFGFQDLQWSRNGKLLAFASLSRILVIAPGSASPKISIDVLGARSLAFTPDNKYLFYNVGDALFTLALATGTASKVPVEIPSFCDLSASPGGTHLLMRTTLEAPGPQFGLYLFDYRKNDLKRIEGPSPSHVAASFFAYKWYVAARNFITGKRKK